MSALAQSIPYGIGSQAKLALHQDESTLFSAPLIQPEGLNDTSVLETQTVQGSMLVASLAPETHESTLHRSYVVRRDDSITSIAASHHVSEDTIRQVNGMYKGARVKADQTLHIPPRDGILHIMREHESIDDVAQTYNVSHDRILYFNEYLQDSSRSLRGAEVFIPDVDSTSHVKPAPVRRYTSPTYSFTPSSASTPATGETTAGFYRGYCTEWAANRTKELGKDAVTWRGNGGAWARNASVQGRTVDKIPEVGAIVSTTEGRYTGHVAVIEKVHEDGSMTISEKNYQGWNKVSERVIMPDDPMVLGIIH